MRVESPRPLTHLTPKWAELNTCPHCYLPMASNNNGGLDNVPKSKIPVPEPPYLSPGFLSELSDQLFFDKPPPLAPLPYSYGPRGILHAPTSPSPHKMRGSRKDYVDYRLEQLLGPQSPLDLIEDNVDDILLQSMKASR